MITMSALRMFSGGASIAGSEILTYLMTEPLNNPDLYWYLDNSESSGVVYDGRLEHSSQSQDGVEGDPWEPSTGQNSQYSQNGTIVLNDINGNGVRQINTQYIIPTINDSTIMVAYDVVVDVSYKMYAIHIKVGGTADIYLGDQDTELTLTYSDVPYIPPLTNWLIKSTPPSIVTATELVYTMESFTTI